MNKESPSKDVVDGSILTAISYIDKVAPAKIVKDFYQKDEGFKMVAESSKGSFVISAAVNPAQACQVNKSFLPNLSVLSAAPISGFVNVLAVISTTT